MPRNQTVDLRDYRRGAEAMRQMIIQSLDERIINLKYAGSPEADTLIRWKNTKLPTVADLLAAEMSDGKYNLSAGLEPKPEARE